MAVEGVREVSDWSTADIPSQQGRVAVVTGTNSGLGFVTARELARAGATVLMTSRDPPRGADAEQRLRAAGPGADGRLEALDLAALGSIRAFAGRVSAAYDGVDVLVNNAGVMAVPRATTVDGFEMQLGTNHLGHFALTGLLLPRIRDRVVTIASGAHRFGRMNFGDLQSERHYQRWLAYGQSKPANLLFMGELQRRLDAAGSPLRSVAAHPGYAATNLQSHTQSIQDQLMGMANQVVAQSARMGALPTLFAVTEDIPGGSYVGPDGWLEQRGHPRLVNMSGAAKDEEAARRLWELSEELTGVAFAVR